MKEIFKYFIDYLKPLRFDWDSEDHIELLIDDFLRTYQIERLNPEDGFDPPPWNVYEYPEKTEGWIEFQKVIRKDPKYLLKSFFDKN